MRERRSYIQAILRQEEMFFKEITLWWSKIRFKA